MVHLVSMLEVDAACRGTGCVKATVMSTTTTCSDCHVQDYHLLRGSHKCVLSSAQGTSLDGLSTRGCHQRGNVSFTSGRTATSCATASK